ncbi:MAG: hypothetical protein OEV30_11905, partial [Ignavibacteria bacterium]|nr:hypothetical protein [Ignavibacteria bacterium]
VLLLFLLVLFQFLLGALTVWTGKNVAVSTAHVATGSLILGCSAALVMAMFRGLLESRESRFDPDLLAERGTA